MHTHLEVASDDEFASHGESVSGIRGSGWEGNEEVGANEEAEKKNRRETQDRRFIFYRAPKNPCDCYLELVQLINAYIYGI